MRSAPTMSPSSSMSEYSCFLRRSGVECSALGVTEPERRRPLCCNSFRGQNPAAFIRVTPWLPTDAGDPWRAVP